MYILLSTGGRDQSEDRNEIIDVDPEQVKKGVRSLMHEVCQIEREKVTVFVQEWCSQNESVIHISPGN